MHQNLYYGEIITYINERLYQYPDHLIKLDQAMDLSEKTDETIFTFIGRSAHIFVTVQDLFDDEPLDWMKAVRLYSDLILDSLLLGEKPNTLDFLQMITQSLKTLD